MNHSMEDMLMGIDNAMPKAEQIGEYLEAKEIQTNELKVGDTVFVQEFDGKFIKHKVMGFGSDTVVNGQNVSGLPYVDMYGDYFSYAENINNYIRTETVRVVEEVADTEE